MYLYWVAGARIVGIPWQWCAGAVSNAGTYTTSTKYTSTKAETLESLSTVVKGHLQRKKNICFGRLEPEVCKGCEVIFDRETNYVLMYLTRSAYRIRLFLCNCKLEV
jgi:hypothetical protein